MRFGCLLSLCLSVIFFVCVFFLSHSLSLSPPYSLKSTRRCVEDEGVSEVHKSPGFLKGLPTDDDASVHIGRRSESIAI